MQKVSNVKQLPVDLKAVMEGLSSLLLPSQRPTFSPHMYAVYIVLFYFPKITSMHLDSIFFPSIPYTVTFMLHCFHISIKILLLDICCWSFFNKNRYNFVFDFTCIYLAVFMVISFTG